MAAAPSCDSTALSGYTITSITGGFVYVLKDLIASDARNLQAKIPDGTVVTGPTKVTATYTCCEVRKPSTLYACKVIPKIKFSEEIPRVLREIQILYSVKHENIVHMFDLAEDKNFVFLFMPLMQDTLFNEIYKRQTYTEEDAKIVISQILCGLAYLHGRGICHRDLKPENLFFCSNGHVTLGGFEFAKYFGGGDLLKTVCGTKRYMAPEVVRNMFDVSAYYTTACDMWSLGVIAYILLTGRFPFPAEEKHVLYAICNDPYDEAPLRNISPDGQAFIRRLLDKDPNNRPTALTLLQSDPWLNPPANPPLDPPTKRRRVDLSACAKNLPRVYSGQDVDDYHDKDEEAADDDDEDDDDDDDDN